MDIEFIRRYYIPYTTNNFPRLAILQTLEYFTVCKPPTQGEFFINAYEILEEPENLTDEKLHQAYTVACAIEAIQSVWMLQDDFETDTSTRAGKPAWHLLPESSNMVIIDMHVIRSFVNEMLLQNIQESHYSQIMDTLNEMYLEFEISKILDFSSIHPKDLDKYTAKDYRKIVSLKAFCCAFNVSLKLSLILSNKATEDNMRLVKSICSNLGV